MDIELYSTEEIIAELKKRFPQMAFVGMKPGENHGKNTYYKYFNGNCFTISGLLSYANHHLMGNFIKLEVPFDVDKQ